MRLLRHQARAGVTLVEVLAAIFILGIGMLAVLVLYPLGALKMAKSLQDSRAGTIAGNADAIATMFDLRQDLAVVPRISNGYSPGGGFDPADPLGRGYPVYVDPHYALMFQKLGPIDRVAPSDAFNNPDRWFTFFDDDTFTGAGVPLLQPQRRYTWAYLLKRSRSSVDDTDLYVVVYSGRSIQLPVLEETYNVSAALPTNIGDTSVVLQWNPGQEKPALKRGAWLLDTTYKPRPRQGINYGYIHAEPYKVMDMVDLPNGVDGNGVPVSQMQLDVQPPLRDADIRQMVILTGAVEVFERGNGRR